MTLPVLVATGLHTVAYSVERLTESEECVVGVWILE